MIQNLDHRFFAITTFFSCASALGLACSSSAIAPGADAGDASPPLHLEAAPPDAPAVFAPIPIDDALLAARPYDLIVPASYSASTPAPLLIGLHGYGDGDDGASFEKYLSLGPTAEEHGVLYTHPDGIKDKNGDRIWNGTDACCNFNKTGSDDVAYLRSVIGDIVKKYNVDRHRIYIVGLSAGGVMAHRLACDAADIVAGVVSVSGTTWKDASKCTPKGAVSIAEVHGDKDYTVRYAGGVSEGAEYPSAPDAMAMWAGLNGCDTTSAEQARIDIETTLAGAETRIDAYPNCKRGAVELWTVEKGPHAPHLGGDFQAAVWNFLASHPKR